MKYSGKIYSGFNISFLKGSFATNSKIEKTRLYTKIHGIFPVGNCADRKYSDEISARCFCSSLRLHNQKNQRF